MKTGGGKFLVVFALFWSAIVLVFDVALVRTFINQTRSLAYASAPGRILSSEVTTGSDSDGGTTYGAKIVYEFRVEGRRYESDRVRFGQMSESGGRWARRMVKAYPAGAECTVYYDPADPDKAVLQTGTSGQDWFLALFLTPFNVVMVFLWAGTVAAFRPSPPLGGARVVTEPGRILAYMTGFTRIGLALAAVGGVAFAGIFALAIPFGFSPKADYVWLVWGVAAAAGVWAWRKGGGPGEPLLIIDVERGVVVLPKGGFTGVQSWSQWREWKRAGMPPLEIPLERIRSVEATSRVSTDSDGSSTSHVVTLSVEEPGATGPKTYDVGSWMLAERSEAFAAWLRETLNLRPSAT